MKNPAPRWRSCLAACLLLAAATGGETAARDAVGGNLEAEAKPVPEAKAEAEPDSAAPPKAYDELRTRGGTVYLGCEVVRAEPDSLIIRHQGGVARVYFHELPEEVQREWAFDPFRAMEHRKAELDRERALRWRLFWERQEWKSVQARLAEEEAIKALAAREWVPVEATVIERLGEGRVLAQCRRVTFEKTTARSTLGFVVDGPPRRVLVPFAQGAVVLRLAAPQDPLPGAGEVWQGYVQPWSEGDHGFTLRGQALSSPVHPAVAAKP